VWSLSFDKTNDGWLPKKLHHIGLYEEQGEDDQNLGDRRNRRMEKNANEEL
jgi:hypothetical protein